MAEIYTVSFFMEQVQSEEGDEMIKGSIRTALVMLVGLLTGCPGATDAIAWKELGNGYIYHEPAGRPYIEKKTGNKGIPALIYMYNNNTEFIIALEKDAPLSSETRDNMIDNGSYHEYMKRNGISRYWIVSLRNDSIYGPLNSQEYMLKRDELGVSRDLLLED